MITLYGISNCDTIKKTRKWLADHELDYQFHDYKKAGCPPTLVRQFLQHFSYTELINTRGTTWRKLPETIKSSLNSKSAVELMSEKTSIIKRPLIHKDGDWILGYDETRLQQLLN